MQVSVLVCMPACAHVRMPACDGVRMPTFACVCMPACACERMPACARVRLPACDGVCMPACNGVRMPLSCHQILWCAVHSHPLLLLYTCVLSATQCAQEPCSVSSPSIPCPPACACLLVPLVIRFCGAHAACCSCTLPAAHARCLLLMHAACCSCTLPAAHARCPLLTGVHPRECIVGQCTRLPAVHAACCSCTLPAPHRGPP